MYVADMSIASAPYYLTEHSAVRRVNVLKGNGVEEDFVIAEEPLELLIAVGQEREALATTMRTPGHDLFLALGYLWSEALPLPTHITRPESCAENNQVLLHYEQSPLTQQSTQRRGIQSSSCGVCGRTSLEDLLNTSYQNRIVPTRRWTSQDLSQIHSTLSENQPLFEQTGGSHAVWLFDSDNVLLMNFEDVGRHNALDKLLGWVIVNHIHDLQNMTLVLSSRLSYELVHKAAHLGVWMIIALGAPSSLAVELSNKLECTTIGFFKKPPYNLYTNRQALYYE